MARLLTLTIALVLALGSGVRAGEPSWGVLDGREVNALKAAVQESNVDGGGSSNEVPRSESARIWSNRGTYTVSLDKASGSGSRAYAVSSDWHTTAVAGVPTTGPSVTLEPVVLSALIAANAQFDKTVQLDQASQIGRANGRFAENYVKRATYVLVNISYTDALIDPQTDKTLPNGCGRFTRAYEVDLHTLSINEKTPSCD